MDQILYQVRDHIAEIRLNRPEEDRTPVPFSTRFYEDQLVKKDGRWLFKSRSNKAD